MSRSPVTTFLLASVAYVAVLTCCNVMSAQDDIFVGGGQVREVDRGVFDGAIVSSGGTLRVLPGEPDMPIIVNVIVERTGRVEIEGGIVADLDNRGGAVVVSGGETGSVGVGAGTVDFFAGSLGNVQVGRDASAGNVRGDAVLNLFGPVGPGSGIFIVDTDGTANVRGGGRLFQAFDTFALINSASMNLFGRDFAIDGQRIDGLSLGDSVSIPEREVTLSGVLEDGSPFEFLLSVDGALDVGTVAADLTALVTVTVTVPEPNTQMLVLSLAWIGAAFRGQHRW